MSFVRMNPRQELREFYPPLTVRRGVGSIVWGTRTGMGQTTSGDISQAAGDAATTVGATGSLLVAAGVLQAVPVAGQIAGAALAITAVIASMFKGCGSTCTLSSDEANNIGNQMATNLAQYLAAPVSAATQTEALANFDQLWAALVNYCGQASLGSAGKNCISERQNGACAYQTSPGGWQQSSTGVWTFQYPGANHSGTTCWNYFVGMRDPIANDPRIAQLAKESAPLSTTAPGSTATAALNLGNLNLQSFLWPGILIGGGLILASILGDL
jgi:hypothetical protein